MKTKILVLICLVMAFSMIFASCDIEQLKGQFGPADANETTEENTKETTEETTKELPQETTEEVTDNEECVHTFSEAWSSDATHHWHRATCEHGEIKDSLAEHVDAEEDGVCDVCEYEVGHEHAYSDEWTSDDSKHWRAASCSHTDEKIDEGLHADTDKNYFCDVCGAHSHILNTATGYCDGCNTQLEEIDTNNLQAIIVALLANSKKVVSGKVDYDVIIRALGSEITQAHNVEYTIYTDGLYTKRTEGTWANEVWRKKNGESVKAVSVEKEGNKVINAEPAAADVDSLVGYYYAVSTLADAYGAENILDVLYQLAKPADDSTNKISNYKEELDSENRTVTFSYSILVINTDTAEGEDDGVNYYEIKIGFGYSEAFVLTSLSIVCDCYTNSLENEAENDYTYDQATQTITMKDTATADTYTFVVTQAVGEKTAIDMVSTEIYIPTDVTIYEDSACTQEATSITVQLSTPTSELPVFYVGCPDGTFVSFIKNDATITVDKEGMTAYLIGEEIQFYPGMAGTYVITFTAGDISKSVTVIVEGEEIGGDATFDLTVTDTYAWIDYYQFTATESGTYTLFIPYGLGIWEESAYDNGRGYTIDYQGNAIPENPTITVELAAGQSYNFYFGAKNKGVYTVGYSFVAHDVEIGSGDEGEDVVNTTPLTVGHNNIEDEDVTYVFYAESDGDLNLAMSLSLMGDVTVTYAVNGGEAVALALQTNVTLTLASGDEVVITVVSTGYATLTATWSTGDEGGETEGDGSEDNPYLIESLPAEYTFESDTVNKVYYLYTATVDGVITITCSIENDSWFDIYPMVNGLPNGAESESSNMKTTAVFTVKAGNTYRIGLGTFNTVGEATFSLTFTEA